jgi:hypothetical protein
MSVGAVLINLCRQPVIAGLLQPRRSTALGALLSPALLASTGIGRAVTDHFDPARTVFVPSLWHLAAAVKTGLADTCGALVPVPGGGREPLPELRAHLASLALPAPDRRGLPHPARCRTASLPRSTGSGVSCRSAPFKRSIDLSSRISPVAVAGWCVAASTHSRGGLRAAVECRRVETATWMEPS